MALLKVSESELIEFAKVYFKERGFKKVAKRWTKEIDQFKLVFFIQGSCYDKDDYYIRPGIIIKVLENEFLPNTYGHFMKEIAVVSLQQIFADTEKFFSTWTDIKFLKKRLKELTHCFELGKRRSKFFDDNENVWIMPERGITTRVLQEDIRLI